MRGITAGPGTGSGAGERFVHAGKRVASEWQANALSGALSTAGVKATMFNEPTKNHLTINSDIGAKNDATTKAIFDFLNANGAVGKK